MTPEQIAKLVKVTLDGASLDVQVDDAVFERMVADHIRGMTLTDVLALIAGTSVDIHTRTFPPPDDEPKPEQVPRKPRPSFERSQQGKYLGMINRFRGRTKDMIRACRKLKGTSSAIEMMDRLIAAGPDAAKKKKKAKPAAAKPTEWRRKTGIYIGLHRWATKADKAKASKIVMNKNLDAGIAYLRKIKASKVRKSR